MRNKLINSVPRRREAATPGPPAQKQSKKNKQEADDEKHGKYLTGCCRHLLIIIHATILRLKSWFIDSLEKRRLHDTEFTGFFSP